MYEHLAELGQAELKIATSLKDVKLITQIFKGVKDEEASVAAMQCLLKIMARLKVNADKAQLKLLEKAFSEGKMHLLSLAVPTLDNLQRKTPSLAIPLL